MTFHKKQNAHSSLTKMEKPIKTKKEKSGPSFGTKTMNVFSKLSKAFLLPIALLPIAGVFLGVGAAISSNAAEQSALWYFGTVLNKMGDVAFGNLPVLFAISTALAFSRDSGVAGITAVVGFLVMNGIQAALLHNHYVGDPNLAAYFRDGQWHYLQLSESGGFDLKSTINYQFYYVPGSFNLPGGGTSLELPGGAISVNLQGMKLDAAGKVYYNLLWVNDIPNGLITQNIGVTSLNTGVLAGIFVGALAAFSFNRFHKTQLPAAISFFSGTKLVPIVAFFLVIPLSFIFILVWPWIGIGLAAFGQMSGKLPVGLDSFIFEIVERSLVPFGLHHVFYAPLWWTNAGGSIAQAFTDAANAWEKDANATFGNSLMGSLTLSQWLDEYAKAFREVVKGIGIWNDESVNNIERFNEIRRIIAQNSDLWGAMGDQTMMYKVIANNSIINFTMLEHLGLNLGRFQSGKFGFMLLGLPMASLAMWLIVPKQNRKQVMGIYASAAFTCFLTGITEPIEYTFLFLAPWLFYGVHMPLAAISFLLAGLLQTHVSMTVSGGVIDYIVFGLIPFFGAKSMEWLSVFGVLIVAVGMGVLYFFAFFFAVKYGKVMVPGRDTSTSGENVKLFTKADYREKEGVVGREQQSIYTTSTTPAEIAKYEKAAKIVEYLGGQENIINVDSCASRLRVDVKDSKKVDKNGIISLGGSTGALIKGTNVQIVYGGEQEAIKPRMIEILGIQRKFQKQPMMASVTNQPLASARATNLDLVLVDQDMMVQCPKCGQSFEIEMEHINEVHPTQSTVVESKKELASKKPITKRVKVQKTTQKPIAKAKVETKHEETKDFVTKLEKKYQKLEPKQTTSSTTKPQSVKERAKFDGSLDVTESRQELQKHASALRQQAKDLGVKLNQSNLRDMTKKEVIDYMSQSLKLLSKTQKKS